MEINGRVSSKNLNESKFSPRKRRGRYPARQLPNCQPVPKEFRRSLQKSRWIPLPTVVLDPKETTFMNGGQLYWDPQDLSMKEGCSFLTLPFHQTIRLNPLRSPSERGSITVISTAKVWSAWISSRTTGVQPWPSRKSSCPSAHSLQTATLLTLWWEVSPHSTWPTEQSTTGWPDSGPSGTPPRGLRAPAVCKHIHQVHQ